MKHIVTRDGNEVGMADDDGTLLDGHHRIDAAHEMGMALFFAGNDGRLIPISFQEWDRRSKLVAADPDAEIDENVSANPAL